MKEKREIVRIDYSKQFIKQLEKAPLEIGIAFRKRLALFFTDSYHPQLRNHALIGQWQGFRSINVTGDWRAVFFEKFDPTQGITIVFVAIGTHSQLYK